MKKGINLRRAVGFGLVLHLAVVRVFGATNELSDTLSKGLFEEEANQNLPAAIQMYQSVIDRFDVDRKLAATALFRLGECYRKQGSTNEAKVQYQRVLREFADQTPLVTLSRQYLLAMGGSPAQTPSGQTNSDGTTSENSASVVEASELSRFEAIIKNSPDLINAPDKSGQTLLQTYAGKGQLNVVKLLLGYGASANGIKHPDLTPLHYAAGNGHKSVVELLLSKGAKPDVTTGSGVTPLHLAVARGYEQVAKVLIDAGAPINAWVVNDVNRSDDVLSYDLYANQTSLAIACSKGYLGLVQLLVARGADVNAVADRNGNTPVTIAAMHNDEEMAKTLLAAKADPNVALASAASAGNLPMLELLLAHGATNLNGALHAALGTLGASRSAVVKKLIQSKADPNSKFSDHRPLIFGALNNPANLTALLDGGADPNQRDSNGQFALELAVTLNGKNDEAVEALLSHGADPNETNQPQGFTALHYAAMSGKTAEAKTLLKHGANINAQDKDGATPLHLALRYRSDEVARLLLENGADPNVRDSHDATPLDIAKGMPAPNAPLPAFAPRLPGSAGPPVLSHTTEEAKPVSIVDLLRQHGASDDLPRLDRIEVRRFPNYSSFVFYRATNDVNHFSLLELLAVHYGFVSAIPYPSPSPVPKYDGASRTPWGSLPFPDLNRIEIRRPKAGGKDWTSIPVSAQAILDSGDCSKDVWLQWGDQVEIPEADHPLSAVWKGFSAETFTNLQNCVKRQIQVTVKGQSTNLLLRVVWPIEYPQPANFNYSPPQFYVAPTLQNSGLMRTSSDLSRVKVTRHNSATGDDWQKTLDCSGATQYPWLWLRDGDIIEVPDKP